MSNKMCNVPFTYNNISQYFCVPQNDQFICQVTGSSTYDACNLGENQFKFFIT
jgi:hypothetical protein